MDASERKGLVVEVGGAILNLVIVLPKAMQKDETFLDLDASVAELKATDLDDQGAIAMAAKEVQRCLSNFLRVHPEIKADANYQPILKDLTDSLGNLLQG